MRISDWSSDVCSSDLQSLQAARRTAGGEPAGLYRRARAGAWGRSRGQAAAGRARERAGQSQIHHRSRPDHRADRPVRSEEHTSELQSLMRISYAVFCLKKKKTENQSHNTNAILNNNDNNTKKKKK